MKSGGAIIALFCSDRVPTKEQWAALVKAGLEEDKNRSRAELGNAISQPVPQDPTCKYDSEAKLLSLPDIFSNRHLDTIKAVFLLPEQLKKFDEWKYVPSPMRRHDASTDLCRDMGANGVIYSAFSYVFASIDKETTGHYMVSADVMDASLSADHKLMYSAVQTAAPKSDFFNALYDEAGPLLRGYVGQIKNNGLKEVLGPILENAKTVWSDSSKKPEQRTLELALPIRGVEDLESKYKLSDGREVTLVNIIFWAANDVNDRQFAHLALAHAYAKTDPVKAQTYLDAARGKDHPEDGDPTGDLDRNRLYLFVKNEMELPQPPPHVSTGCKGGKHRVHGKCVPIEKPQKPAAPAHEPPPPAAPAAPRVKVRDPLRDD